jgi:hypothetical protein
MSNRPTISRVRTAFLGAAVVAAVALVPRSAAGQSATTPPGQVSAHGACGPGHPNVELFVDPPIGMPGPGYSRRKDSAVGAVVRRTDLVMVGRVASAATAAGKNGIWTTATFDYPLILKSPPGGPAPGAAEASARFFGGTAMFRGACTKQRGNDLLPGKLYLVFAKVIDSGRRLGQLDGEAYTVQEPSGLLAGRILADLYFPLGVRPTLAAVVAEIKAEVAREKAAAGGVSK